MSREVGSGAQILLDDKRASALAYLQQLAREASKLPAGSPELAEIEARAGRVAIELAGTLI